MLPAYIANATPVFFSRVKMGRILDAPVDLGRMADGKRIFGNHKTVKGFLFGTLFGVLTSVAQFYLFNWNEYSFYSAVLIGFLLGFGALVGDSVKSFFKRRRNIKAGKSWPIFDQIDYALGALVFVSIAVELSWEAVIVILIASPLLSFISNIAGYFLKLKKVWW